jgi:predicted DsbA family dithiol-disulfide isomerase
MVDNLKAVADELNLPFGERDRTCNSRLAQELGLWAESRGKGEEFHSLAFRAYFGDGVNLAHVPILLQLAENAGLPRTEAEKVLSRRSFKDAVDTDWADSRCKGIAAIPTFILNDCKMVGAQSYEILARMLTENGVEKR